MSDAEDESKRVGSQAQAPPKDKGRVNRRQAIQTVVAGSSVVAGSLALPKRWTKPIVEAIVSPVAAQGFSPPITITMTMTGPPISDSCTLFPSHPSCPPI